MLEPGVRELAEEAHRLNETARIYGNLMAANVRRRLQILAGDAAGGYRANGHPRGLRVRRVSPSTGVNHKH